MEHTLHQKEKKREGQKRKLFMHMKAVDETIEQEVTQLNKLCKTCHFREESVIKDGIVCGVSNKGISERLLHDGD